MKVFFTGDYSRFCELHRSFEKTLSVTMHQTRRPQQTLRRNLWPCDSIAKPRKRSVEFGQAAFVTRRIARSGCLAGIRASMSTYENNAPLVRSPPRIDPSRFADLQANRNTRER